MQTNAWMEPGKGFLGLKPGECPQLDMAGTEKPSLIIRGGILVGHGGRNKTSV